MNLRGHISLNSTPDRDPTEFPGYRKKVEAGLREFSLFVLGQRERALGC